MRRVLVVAIAAVFGAGVWSTVAHATPAASSLSSTPAPTDVVVTVVEDAPVCTAEQIEAPDDGAVASSSSGSTVVSFTLVDPRCES